ncbi:MAG TPA: substrate-binding domain-containing protein [Verrucomicrobiae bacterium]|jgi:hypothetical protein|nr:substrate-binding domain-containing protein [Verrucomicrobiae bacterium]HEX4264150.1 substrate-binding domain-containing protein [Verrucomicrobiae bacterium]
MSRPRTEKVNLLKTKLIVRIKDGFHKPGDRFLSNRALAKRYGVSYQTAHRVVTELSVEGLLERRAASGTYVAGQRPLLRGVELWFHARARRPGSFGANLLEHLQRGLREAKVPHVVRWPSNNSHLSVDYYPVLWEVPALLAEAASARRYALLLNDRPEPGLTATLVDAVATDDFSAGVCAAEALREHVQGGRRFLVLAGPAADKRSKNRVRGFLSCLPKSRVISAGGWYLEDGAKVAARALAIGKDGIFCVNDRLAEALLLHCETQKIRRPAIIGHDNAPVAEELHLSTIAIEWDEMTSVAIETIRRRLASQSGNARHIILTQRPVYRLTT